MIEVMLQLTFAVVYEGTWRLEALAIDVGKNPQKKEFKNITLVTKHWVLAETSAWSIVQVPCQEHNNLLQISPAISHQKSEGERDLLEISGPQSQVPAPPSTPCTKKSR